MANYFETHCFIPHTNFSPILSLSICLLLTVMSLLPLVCYTDYIYHFWWYQICQHLNLLEILTLRRTDRSQWIYNYVGRLVDQSHHVNHALCFPSLKIILTVCRWSWWWGWLGCSRGGWWWRGQVAPPQCNQQPEQLSSQQPQCLVSGFPKSSRLHLNMAGTLY